MTTNDLGTESPSIPGRGYRVRCLVLLGVLSVMSIAFLIDQVSEQKWILIALGYKDENKLDQGSVLKYLDGKIFPLKNTGDRASKDEDTVTLKKHEIRGLSLVHAPGGRADLTQATFSIKTERGWYEFEIVMPTEIPTDEWQYVNPHISRVTRR
jgi:hypothetical protein